MWHFVEVCLVLHFESCARFSVAFRATRGVWRTTCSYILNITRATRNMYLIRNECVAKLTKTGVDFSLHTGYTYELGCHRSRHWNIKECRVFLIFWLEFHSTRHKGKQIQDKPGVTLPRFFAYLAIFNLCRCLEFLKCEAPNTKLIRCYCALSPVVFGLAAALERK